MANLTPSTVLEIASVTDSVGEESLLTACVDVWEHLDDRYVSILCCHTCIICDGWTCTHQLSLKVLAQLQALACMDHWAPA